MKMGPPTILTEAEEQVLVNYIKFCNDRAHPATKDNIIQTVKQIVTEERDAGYKRKNLPASFVQGHPGEKWWKLFKRRHPNISYRSPETLTSARKNVSQGSIRQWFADTYQYITDVDALDALHDPSRNFNIDESGFSLSPKQGKVLALRGEKAVFEQSSIHQKSNITVLAVVGADGSVPPPMIIYPRKRINPMFSEEFPPNFPFIVGKSDKGYITYETLYEYLCNSFNDWLTTHNITRPVIVWTDWHETRNNYFLAKTLNQQNIILYGLPPNSTHLMQPLDVTVFGPMKKGWSKTAKAWENENNDEIITQANFAKVFLPCYYQYMKKENIVAGFTKCGLVPFNPDSPDYTKLKANAAQRANEACIFEGVDLGGKVERSTQTDQVPHRQTATQTGNILTISTQGERLENFNYEGSLCDMILEYKGYSDLRKRYQSLPFHSVSRPLEFRRSLPSLVDVVGPSSPDLIDLSTPGPSGITSPRTGASPPSISPLFAQHRFYPERRPGKGPKVVRNVLDRVYAISSQQMVDQLLRQKEDKDKKEEEKKKRKCERTKKSTTKAKKTKTASNAGKTPDPVPVLSSEDEHISLHDSSDSTLILDDGGEFGIQLPLAEPVNDSWIGVKVEKEETSGRGRVYKPSFEIYIGRVQSIDSEGMTVSFVREKSTGFFFFPDQEDISYPVLRSEVVVLDPPKPLLRNRLGGFQFPSDIITSIRSYFARDKP